MLYSIEIRNFKNFRHADISLERLTVFVGANASGKTSVLEAIHWCQLAASGDPVKVFGYDRHCDWLYTRGGDGDLSLLTSTRHGSYGIRASLDKVPDFNEEKPDQLGQGRWTLTKLPTADNVRNEGLRDGRSMVFLHLSADLLAQDSYSEDQPPRVEFDGRRLPSVLAYMKLTDDDAFDRIQDLMCRFVPKFRKIRIQKKTIREVQTELLRVDSDSFDRRVNRSFPGEGLLFDFANAKNISAASVSEGTLLLLGLLTILHGPVRPNVILMDDIDHGLHPLAQKQLLTLLHAMLEEFPKLQIIASAHSPYLLDGLQPEEVRLVMADRDGYSTVRRLSDHSDFVQWKDEMAPGEMWSLFGDQWEAGKETPR